MAKISLLIDTDIFIDYFNTGMFSNIIENKAFNIYYSVITMKELLSKSGLKASEKESIIHTLKNYREIRLDIKITQKYSEIRNQHTTIDKEDALIAASAIVKNLPLLTRNIKHFDNIDGLVLAGKHDR